MLCSQSPTPRKTEGSSRHRDRRRHPQGLGGRRVDQHQRLRQDRQGRQHLPGPRQGLSRLSRHGHAARKCSRLAAAEGGEDRHQEEAVRDRGKGRLHAPRGPRGGARPPELRQLVARLPAPGLRMARRGQRRVRARRLLVRPPAQCHGSCARRRVMAMRQERMYGQHRRRRNCGA